MRAAFLLMLLGAGSLGATPPVLSYLFPAGGQRGTSVPVRVGGLFLHNQAELSTDGPGLVVEKRLRVVPRIWFEGPIIPLPDSQQPEDYPTDRQANITIDKQALLGPRKLRVSTAQGVGMGPLFVVGDLPEVLEVETDGDPIPQGCKLPVTANGRIFPRTDLDVWSFALQKGETLTATVQAQLLRSPLIPRLELLNEAGEVLAESGPRPLPNADASLTFVAPASGLYQVRIGDTRNQGGPAYVYRLTLTTKPMLIHYFPLGGQRGNTVQLQLQTTRKPDTVKLSIPANAPENWSTTLPSGEAITLATGTESEYLNSAEPLQVPAVLNGRAGETPWKLHLKKDQPYEFDFQARRLGSPLCAVLTFSKDGEIVQREQSPDPMQDPVVVFRPRADGVYVLQVSERFKTRGGPEFVYRCRVRQLGQVEQGFKVKSPLESLSIPRGGSAKVRFNIERFNSFNSPIELQANGLPTGVKFSPTTINANQNNLDVTVTVAESAKVQTASISITAKPTKGPAMDRLVTFNDSSSLLLAITVPTPFKFTGEYTMGNSPRGQPYSRRYKLERNGFTGPITVSLADKQVRHLQGVTGPTLVIPPEQSEFTYSVQLPPWIELGRTSRTTLMAVGEIVEADGTRHTVSFTSGEQNHQLIVVPEPGKLGLDLPRSTIVAKPGQVVQVPFQLTRTPDLNEEAKVLAEVPLHWKGVSVKGVSLDRGQNTGTLELKLATDAEMVFNMPLTIQARIGNVIAEAKLELLK